MHPNPTHVPVPDSWPRPKRPLRLVLAVGYLGLFALGMIVGAVRAIMTSQMVTAVLLIIGALWFGHLVGLAASQLRQSRGRGRATTGATDDGEMGLAYTYARAPYYWLLSVVGLAAVALVGVTCLAILAGGPLGWVVALLAAAGAGYLIWFCAVVARLAPGRVVITPTGIYHRSLTFEHFVPWFAVTDVVADQEDHPVIAVQAYPAEGSRYAGSFRSYESQYLPFIVVRSYRLGPNTLPAFQSLNYYFRNPQERRQLSTSPRTFIKEP